MTKANFEPAIRLGSQGGPKWPCVWVPAQTTYPEKKTWATFAFADRAAMTTSTEAPSHALGFFHFDACHMPHGQLNLI